MKELTLRQMEILRAIVISGSISGAARFLNVTQPGISRALKHLETGLGVKLFVRGGGRLVPAPEARDVFEQLHQVYDKLGDLNHTIGQLSRGRNVDLAIGSVPSIAHRMVPSAVAAIRSRFPDLQLTIDILRIEEAADYLMLRKGELVCLSARIDNAALDHHPLAHGRLLCITHRAHPLAVQSSVSIRDMARHPMIGVDPGDPHGRILTDLFAGAGLTLDAPIQARFGTTVIALVKQRLGIAVVDTFTIGDAGTWDPDLAVLPIREETGFETYVARRRDIEPSGFAREFVDLLADIMMNVTLRT